MVGLERRAASGIASPSCLARRCRIVSPMSFTAVICAGEREEPRWGKRRRKDRRPWVSVTWPSIRIRISGGRVENVDLLMLCFCCWAIVN